MRKIVQILALLLPLASLPARPAIAEEMASTPLLRALETSTVLDFNPADSGSPPLFLTHCTANQTCANGCSVSCTGHAACLVYSTSVSCDGVTTECPYLDCTPPKGCLDPCGYCSCLATTSWSPETCAFRTCNEW